MKEQPKMTSHEAPLANEMARLLRSQELRDKIGVELMKEELMQRLIEKYGEDACDKTQMFHLLKGSNVGTDDSYYTSFDFDGDDSIVKAVESEYLLNCPQEKVQAYLKKYS